MIGLRLGQDGKQRIDARFDGTFANQLGAEAVNRVDVRFLEPLERLVEPRRARPRRVAWPRLAVSSASRRRSFSSPAAFSVNVTATICSIVVAARLRARAESDSRARSSSRFRPRPRRPACRRGRRGWRARAASSSGGADARTVIAWTSGPRGRRARSRSLCATRSSSRGPQTGRKSHHVQARSAGAAARNPCSIDRSMIVSTCRPWLRL